LEPPVDRRIERRRLDQEAAFAYKDIKAVHGRIDIPGPADPPAVTPLGVVKGSSVLWPPARRVGGARIAVEDVRSGSKPQPTRIALRTSSITR
jgi:hypothetical protein